MTASQTPPRTPASTPANLRPRSTTTFKNHSPRAKRSTQTTLSATLAATPPPANPTPLKPCGWDQPAPFRAYMTEKQRKLRDQFSANFRAPSSAILHDVVIWVDGYTTPSRLQLRSIVGLHGGRLETYFSPRIVTHVVAETLAAATRRRLKDASASYRVVTPRWVVDSLQRGVRLPERDYQVPGMSNPSQKSIATMFKPVKKGRAAGKQG